MRYKGLRRRLNLNARPLTVDDGINAAWSAEVGSVTSCDGRSLTVLIVVDEFRRACLAIETLPDLRASRVIQWLNRIAVRVGYPRKLQIDHGVELESIAPAKWALTHGVELCFIHPTTGIQKTLIEQFFKDQNRAVLKKHTFEH